MYVGSTASGLSALQHVLNKTHAVVWSRSVDTSPGLMAEIPAVVSGDEKHPPVAQAIFPRWKAKTIR